MNRQRAKGFIAEFICLAGTHGHKLFKFSESESKCAERAGVINCKLKAAHFQKGKVNCKVRSHSSSDASCKTKNQSNLKSRFACSVAPDRTGSDMGGKISGKNRISAPGTATAAPSSRLNYYYFIFFYPVVFLYTKIQKKSFSLL